MSEYIYYFNVNRRKQSAGIAVEAVAETPNIIMKNCKSNISLLSVFICPCRVRDKSELESERPHRVSLWSGSISSTATRPAFWPGPAGTHVMPQLHKRFSFPPDKLVTISGIPSVGQTHQCPFQKMLNL